MQVRSAERTRTLASVGIDAPGNPLEPWRIHADLAVTGANWGKATATGAVVEVLVDGRHQSDIIATAEHPPGWDILIGALSIGHHEVELRERPDLSPAGVGVAVSAMSASASTGEQALIDRFAPIVQGRSVPPAMPQQQLITDTPLVMLPLVQHQANGDTRLTYRVLFSNEDGGTNTVDLMSHWGRTTDFEWAYSVEVDNVGNVVPGSETYQGANHRTQKYTARHDGERPLLRVATGNNNFDQKLGTASTWFSGAPDLSQKNITVGLESMIRAPWTFRTMVRELQREGKVRRPGEAPAPTDPGVTDGRVIDDPHRYVYVASHTAGPVLVQLADGRTIKLEPNGDALKDHGASAVELPKDVDAAQLASVSLPGPGRAFVLDGDDMPRLVGSSLRHRRAPLPR